MVSSSTTKRASRPGVTFSRTTLSTAKLFASGVSGASGTSTPEGEKEDIVIESFLRAMGVEGTKRKGGKEPVSKLESKEVHR